MRGLDLTIGWMAFECVGLVCCDQGVDWQLLSMHESEAFFSLGRSRLWLCSPWGVLRPCKTLCLACSCFSNFGLKILSHVDVSQAWCACSCCFDESGGGSFHLQHFPPLCKICNLSKDWCWVVQIKQNWHGVEILIDEYAVLMMVVMKVMVLMTLKMMVNDDEQWWMIF